MNECLVHHNKVHYNNGTIQDSSSGYTLANINQLQLHKHRVILDFSMHVVTKFLSADASVTQNLHHCTYLCIIVNHLALRPSLQVLPHGCLYFWKLNFFGSIRMAVPSMTVPLAQTPLLSPLQYRHFPQKHVSLPENRNIRIVNHYAFGFTWDMCRFLEDYQYLKKYPVVGLLWSLPVIALFVPWQKDSLL